MGADGERIHKAGADRLHVERRGVGRADLRLHQTGRGWHRLVGRGRADDDQIDLFGSDSGAFQCLFRGCRTHGRGCVVGTGNMPFPNTGARPDPFVRGINHLFEVGVGQDSLRHIHAPTSDRAIVHRPAPYRIYVRCPPQIDAAYRASLCCVV